METEIRGLQSSHIGNSIKRANKQMLEFKYYSNATCGENQPLVTNEPELEKQPVEVQGFMKLPIIFKDCMEYTSSL